MMKYIELHTEKGVLRGMVHRAAGKANPYPIVIVHGYFSANRVGPQRLFVEISNFLSSRGYNVYRFDLSGMGESDGDISNIKFGDHVDDVETIINYVRKQHHNKRVIVIAHCLGCNLTLARVLSNQDAFREVIFLAPFYSNDVIMNKLFDDDKLKELVNAKYTYRKGLYADYSFFAENTQQDFIASVNATPITINVILPEEDQYIPLECNKETFCRADRINLITLAGADHNFLQTHDEISSIILELLQDEKYTV
ncbi:MAG: alpha/beta fold hydrolase [Clostridiales bacterium]|nr:alpha/beta fold hydrolase [Clostridiales bacterium]